MHMATCSRVSETEFNVTDSNTQGLGHAYQGKTFTGTWEHFGLSLFVMHLITHM